MCRKRTLLCLLILTSVFMVLAQGKEAGKRRVFFAAEDAVGVAAAHKPVALMSKRAGKAEFSSRVLYGDLIAVPMKDGKQYTRIALPGLERTGEPGMPVEENINSAWPVMIVYTVTPSFVG